MEKKQDQAREFAQIFENCWKSKYSNQNPEQMSRIDSKYPNNKEWTAFMLNERQDGEAGFLCEVSEKWIEDICQDLKFRSLNQWYTMDAYAIEKSSQPPFIDSRIHLIIEHENGEDIETEMWKLLFFRCPLKVLVCYDYNDIEEKDWLSKKIGKLNGMITDSNVVHPEDSSTQYLLVVGNRDEEQQIKWRYWIAETGNDFKFASP